MKELGYGVLSVLGDTSVCSHDQPIPDPSMTW